MSAAESTKKTSDTEIADDNTQKKQVELLSTIGNEVSGSSDRRLLWMELLDAIFQALERPDDFDVKKLPTGDELPYNQRKDLHIVKVESKYYEDISTYLDETVLAQYESDKKSRLERLGLLKVAEEGEEGAQGEAASTATDTAAAADTATAAGGDESTAGWVIQLDGYHYHNGKEYAPTGDELEDYVLKTLIHRLETGSVKLPLRDGSEVEFTYSELGISSPFVLGAGVFKEKNTEPNPEYAKQGGPAGGGVGGMGMSGGGRGMGGPGGGMGAPGGTGGRGTGGAGGPSDVGPDGKPLIKPFFEAPKFEFQVQMVWRERPLTPRLEAKRAAEEAAAAAAAEAAAAAGELTEDDAAGDEIASE